MARVLKESPRSRRAKMGRWDLRQCRCSQPFWLKSGAQGTLFTRVVEGSWSSCGLSVRLRSFLSQPRCNARFAAHFQQLACKNGLTSSAGDLGASWPEIARQWLSQPKQLQCAGTEEVTEMQTTEQHGQRSWQCELSAARQALESAELAPGNLSTLRSSMNRERRPARPREAPAPVLLNRIPGQLFELDEERFAKNVRSARRGRGPIWDDQRTFVPHVGE